jgi:hypothetical protein
VAAFGEGLKKFKMVAVAMVTKVQKMLNSLQTSQSFAVMFPVTSTSKKSESIGQTLRSCHGNKKRGDLKKK